MIRNKPAMVSLLILLLILIGLVGFLILPGCQGVRISPTVPEVTETPQSTTAVENTATSGTTTTLHPAAQTPDTAQIAELSTTAQTASRTLKMRHKGKDVKRLQQRLTDLGYLPGPIDGVFSERTYNAVIAFQKVNGLHRDGIAGPNTLRALGHPKTVAARRDGNHVEVNKTLQVLLIVKRGKVAKILPCSTGKPGFRTPSVASAVDWKAGHIYESRKYGGTMVWASFFYGGVAVHGYASVPPYPASHGCVRIPVPDSKYVYDTMPVGSMVYIY